ncbi:MAG: hypothetical protein ABIM21_01400 [candidate division WOR-3 bacterium]
MTLFLQTAEKFNPVFSFLIPGVHHLKTKEWRPLIYTSVEATLVTIYGVNYYRQRVLFNYARTLARDKCGVTLPSSYSENWRLVEAHYSYDEYVEYLYRVARQLYPDDPTKQDEYVTNRLPKFYWKWHDLESYYEFQRELRIYREISSKKTLILGLILLNHLASGIDNIVSSEIKNRAKLDVGTKTSFYYKGFDLYIFYRF